jgi:hypothetical protein
MCVFINTNEIKSIFSIVVKADATVLHITTLLFVYNLTAACECRGLRVKDDYERRMDGRWSNSVLFQVYSGVCLEQRTHLRHVYVRGGSLNTAQRGIMISKGNLKIRRGETPSPVRRISHKVIRDWTRASEVICQSLTAWAMALSN